MDPTAACTIARPAPAPIGEAVQADTSDHEQAAGDGPRAARAPRVAALVLAAGSSRRMGVHNKLLHDVGGEAMIRRVVAAVQASGVDAVYVVLGHEAGRVRAALAAAGVHFVDNPHHARGMSSSLRAGLAALPAGVDGVLVCLGDMPWVSAADIDRLLGAFDPGAGRALCVPTHRGRRGNPVLWGRRYFAELAGVRGDIGGRALLEHHAGHLCEVPMPTDAVLRDVDTPEALRAGG